MKLHGFLLVLVLGTVAYGQNAGKYYKNDRWGFKVRFPSDWKQAAMSADEEWIVAKFTDTRLLWSKKTDNAGYSEADYPNQWVIGFPHKRQEDRGAKVEKDGNKTKITFKNPYKGYKDFVKREKWFVGGGYHFSKEKEVVIKGKKVTQYEIAVEKMVSSPYRIVCWVYHFDDIDFAVQFKILDDYYKKHRAAFKNCLKSFSRIERKRALRSRTTTGDSIIERLNEDKMTPEEKAKSRQDSFERTLRKEQDNLPKDWYVLRSKHYVVMANCSKKYAKTVLNHAGVIRGYLDKKFANIGYDYVPPGIIRIFTSEAERRAFQQSTSTNWFSSYTQISLTEESKKSGLKTWAMESVSSNVTSQWLSFKNRNLSDNMPWWFKNGLEQHMRFARVKGKSVKIHPDEVDRDWIKQEIKKNKTVPIKELFEKGDNNMQSMFGMQAGSVVTYLLGKGSRGKTKNIVQNYMKNMIGAIQEAEAEYDKKNKAIDEAAKKKAAEQGEPEGESEDESEEDEPEGDDRWEKIRAALKGRAAAIRKIAFDKTFGALTDKDWKKLDRQWRDYAG